METKDLTVSQTTEVAKRQTTEVAHRKGELAQRPSMQESGQKALLGSDGVEDAEFMDVTDCRESGGWFEFLSFLFKKKSARGKLSRRIRNKCVSGKELTEAECLELIHSGNIQYFCNFLNRQRFTSELETELIKCASDRMMVMYFEKFYLGFDAFILLFKYRSRSLCSHYINRIPLDFEWEAYFVGLDDAEIFEKYVSIKQLRGTGQRALFAVCTPERQKLFHIYFDKYGMEGFSANFQISAAICSNNVDYYGRRMEKSEFSVNEQRLLAAYGKPELIRLYIHVYGMANDAVVQRELLERQDNELLFCYLGRNTLLPENQLVLIESGDCSVLKYYIQVYGLRKASFSQGQTAFPAGYLEVMLIKRGDVGLLQCYIERFPLELPAQKRLVCSGDSSILRFHIEKHGLDKSMASLLIERGEEDLIKLYIKKTALEPDDQNLLLENASADVILLHILRYGLERSIGLEQRLLNWKNSGLIRAYCKEKPFNKLTEIDFVLTGNSEDVKYYIEKFGLAEDVPLELIRRGDVALFETYVKQHKLTVKEQAYLLGFGKQELLLNYLWFHRLSKEIESDFLRASDPVVVGEYRKKYGIIA